MKQFGFIGMGNMGYAILKGLLKTVAPDQLIFSARNKAHMEQVAAETGVSYAADNVTCAKDSACRFSIVIPGAMEMMICSSVTASRISPIIVSNCCGFTASTRQELSLAQLTLSAA